MDDEKTLREGIRDAEPDGAHLRKDEPADEPARPEAVNLEREDPITDAARRRDSFGPDEKVPARARRAEADAREVAEHADRRASAERD